MAKKPAEELIWASEVMEVYRNLGTPVEDQRWSSPSSRYLHTWLRESEKNETAFLKDLVPKATGILEKYGVADIDDEVVLMDSKTVKDLQTLLRDALVASKGGVYKEEVSEEPKSEAPQKTAPGGLMDESGVERALREGKLEYCDPICDFPTIQAQIEADKPEAPQETTQVGHGSPGGLMDDVPSLDDLF